MLLQNGTQLGHYEILSPVGAGGMGEVCKARDPRLNRTVAVKVLPRHVAQRSDLKQRFEREAQTIAALNHPHICAVYDVGRERPRPASGGVRASSEEDGDRLHRDGVRRRRNAGRRHHQGAAAIRSTADVRHADLRRARQSASSRHHASGLRASMRSVWTNRPLT
jgi:serine/threonine protein kinase